MAFNIYAIRKDIANYLTTELPQFQFRTDSLPENIQMLRDTEGEVNPFFIVRPGKIRPRPRGRSIAGPRHDDYYTWIDVICVGTEEDAVAESLSLVADYLVGYKPAGGTGIIPDGGQDDFITRNYASRPTLYVNSNRFEFGINIAPSPRPTRPTTTPLGYGHGPYGTTPYGG